MADAVDSKSTDSNILRVQVPFSAPLIINIKMIIKKIDRKDLFFFNLSLNYLPFDNM